MSPASSTSAVMASESGVSTAGEDHVIPGGNSPVAAAIRDGCGHGSPTTTTATTSTTSWSNHHVIQSEGHSIEGLESEEDTAGEEGETLPPESSTTTTDAVNDPLEPIDFIETRPPPHHHHAHCYNGAVGHGRGVFPPPPSTVHYENWSILVEMEEGGKKGEYLCIPMSNVALARPVEEWRFGKCCDSLPSPLVWACYIIA